MGSNGSIGVLCRGPKEGSKIIMNSIGWPLNPGLLGLVFYHETKNSNSNDYVFFKT